LIFSCGRAWRLQISEMVMERRMLPVTGEVRAMIRKLKSGEYRLYSRRKNAKTGKRRNLGTFGTRAAAERHERAVQFFKRH
jgi:hypothetical protein